MLNIKTRVSAVNSHHHRDGSGFSKVLRGISPLGRFGDVYLVELIVPVMPEPMVLQVMLRLTGMGGCGST